MTALLTVGLPVYNSMPYLVESMESLFSQTVKDFKILAIVDDCTDGSVEYIESLRDPRLRVIRRPKSSLVDALNQTLREVDTPWLVRQDTDDVSYPNRIERVLEWIERKPDAGMFYSLAEYYPKDQCVGQFRCTRGNPEELRKIAQSGYLLAFCHPSVVLNAQKTLAIGGYTENLHSEDTDLWWRMALHYDIQFIPEVLVGYRQHSSSLTTHNLVKSHIEGLYNQYRLLSHLNNRQPQPLESVRDLLASFTSQRELDAKEKLRNMNIRLSQRRYAGAAFAAFEAFVTSPKYFMRRLLDELQSSRRPITNGVSPLWYMQRKAEFWP
jgi:glycosyltransferase involved in cell wall biosynthesis